MARYYLLQCWSIRDRTLDCLWHQEEGVISQLIWDYQLWVPIRSEVLEAAYNWQSGRSYLHLIQVPMCCWIGDQHNDDTAESPGIQHPSQRYWFLQGCKRMTQDIPLLTWHQTVEDCWRGRTSPWSGSTMVTRWGLSSGRRQINPTTCPLKQVYRDGNSLRSRSLFSVLILWCNTTGTDKLPLIMIGKFYPAA